MPPSLNKSSLHTSGLVLRGWEFRYADRLRGFHQGLKDTSYVEGENVAVVYRWAEGHDDRLPALAADLVRRQIAVIAATSTSPALVAKAEAAMIPIVFMVAEDRSSLVLSPALLGRTATRRASIFTVVS
jgi:ABC-type uncharacterized transport system substrate-binding protein